MERNQANIIRNAMMALAITNPELELRMDEHCDEQGTHAITLSTAESRERAELNTSSMLPLWAASKEAGCEIHVQIDPSGIGLEILYV